MHPQIILYGRFAAKEDESDTCGGAAASRRTYRHHRHQHGSLLDVAPNNFLLYPKFANTAYTRVCHACPVRERLSRVTICPSSTKDITSLPPKQPVGTAKAVVPDAGGRTTLGEQNRLPLPHSLKICPYAGSSSIVKSCVGFSSATRFHKSARYLLLCAKQTALQRAPAPRVG